MSNPLLILAEQKFSSFDKSKDGQISFKEKIGEMDFSAYLFSKKNAKRLYVMLSGALSSDRKTSFTYHRWSWVDKFDGSVLFIADPVLSNNFDLNIAWYIGTKDYTIDKYISEYVVLIAQKLGVSLNNIIAYGSSAGGFASIQLASNIGEGALAVAINPQTNIFDYLEKPVQDLVQKVWQPSVPDKNNERFNLLCKDLRHCRILFIQNKQDISHFEKHMLPFVSIFSDLDINLPYSKQKGNIRVIQYDHPSGHAAEPKELLPEIFNAIDYMLEHVSLAKNKFFILGSCVSRDVFLPKYRKEIGSCGYYPRTTFARLSLKEVNDIPEFSSLSSPFQKKILRQDFKLDVLNNLSNVDFDFILIDLIDDRYGLVKFNDTYVTNSFELNCSKVCEISKENTIPAESDLFFTYWKTGFLKFLNFCQEYNLVDKIVLNRVFWAEKLDDGGSIDGFSLEKIKLNNELLNRLYEFIILSIPDIKVIDYSVDFLVAKRNHKWGIMPFHYIDEFYEHSYKKLSSLN